MRRFLEISVEPQKLQEDKRVSLLNCLTLREKEVLTLVSQGLSNKEIARVLFMSKHTVRNHLSNIFGKLDVRNRTSATALALSGCHCEGVSPKQSQRCNS